MLHATVRLTRGTFELDATVDVAAGETVALLGPNGAGKTSFVRAVAGLDRAGTGRIVLGGDVLDDAAAGVFVPPEARSVGVVFQDYLLFPHLTVLDNVAFGLRSRGARARDARERAGAWLDRLGLAAFARARPATLSGGQAQRVALARALAIDPRVLLLDEPLAALDVTTRAATRRELHAHLKEHAGARIVITHDPLEAAVLADRIVVLEHGKVVQSGTPSEISAQPRSAYVADLVGVNLFSGDSSGRAITIGDATLLVPDAPTGAVFATVHPRSVVLHRRPPEGSARNVWQGRVGSVDIEGERVRVRVDAPLPLVAEVSRAAADELDLFGGGEVWIAVKATEVNVFEA